MVRPLYDCRVSDLGTDDVLVVECGCGHREELTALMLRTAGVKPYTKVVDLQRRMKCRECRWKGRATVSVRWGRRLVLLRRRGRTTCADNRPEHHKLGALKSLIAAIALVLTIFGAGADIVEHGGLIQGDGLDHSVPYVASTVSASTITESAGLTVIVDTITGDEHALPPIDASRAGIAKPAALIAGFAGLMFAVAVFGFCCRRASWAELGQNR